MTRYCIFIIFLLNYALSLLSLMHNRVLYQLRIPLYQHSMLYVDFDITTKYCQPRFVLKII